MPWLFLQSHFVFKALLGSFPPPLSSQVYVRIWFTKSGFASPARNPSTSFQRESGAQHTLCRAGPLQQLVQGNTLLSSALAFSPCSQAFSISNIFQWLLHLPKLPASLSSHPAAVFINRDTQPTRLQNCCPGFCQQTSETWREERRKPRGKHRATEWSLFFLF